MTKQLVFLFSTLLIFLCSCFNSPHQSADDGSKFIGQWQSSKEERRIYTIAQINENTFTLKWPGWNEPASGGSISIPGQLVLGGEETLMLSNGNLVMLGMPVVSYVSKEELLIHNVNCRRR